MSAVTLTKKQKAFAWVLFILSASFLLFQFLMQFTSGLLVKDIMRDFGVAAIGASVITSAYYLSYVAMQTPAGMLVDRFGARKLLSLGAIIAALGCLLFATTHWVLIAILGRFLMGLGMSCGFVSGLFICRNWFSKKMYMFLLGLFESVGMFGIMFGNAYVANIISQVGWRTFVFSTFVIGVGFAILNPLLIRNTPDPNGLQRPLSKIKPSLYFIRDVKLLIKNKRAWINGIFSGILVTPQTTFIALWGVPFLVTAHHFTLREAAFSTVLIFLGVAVAAPFYGILFNFLKKPYYVLSLSAVIVGVLFSLVIFDLHMSYYLVSLCFLLIGINSNVYLWNYTMISDIAPKPATSTKIGFTNTLAIGVGPILQVIIAAILSLFGDAHTVHGEVLYSTGDYQIGLSVMPILFFAAAVMAFYCKYKPQH